MASLPLIADFAIGAHPRLDSDAPGLSADVAARRRDEAAASEWGEADDPAGMLFWLVGLPAGLVVSGLGIALFLGFARSLIG